MDQSPRPTLTRHLRSKLSDVSAENVALVKPTVLAIPGITELFRKFENRELIRRPELGIGSGLLAGKEQK